MKCPMRSRKDDIPKTRAEKSWICELCGAIQFANKRPNCVRAKAENARAQVAQIRKRFYRED